MKLLSRSTLVPEGCRKLRQRLRESAHLTEMSILAALL